MNNFGRSGDILSVYFSRIFPFNEIYEWLSYGDEKTFACREFAMNFLNDQQESFLRNQAYKNGSELKHNVKRLRPIKLDVGAVYNASPLTSSKQNLFYPVQKELVFDIDVTDYDDIRTCCSKARICDKCWKYMAIAVKILDEGLREDFGFNSILWVFSGRRGIHGWVCDKRARFLTSNGRFAIANYFQLIRGGTYKKKKVEIDGKIHPFVKRALSVIQPLFKEFCVVEQDMLGTEKGVITFLGLFSKENMRMEVANLLIEYPTSLTRWEAFVDFFQCQITSGSKDWCETPFLIEEIMIQYAYPRLDIWVTLERRHLLKCPFCVHPNNKKIGVPLDIETIENFDPNRVPHIMRLMEEIDVFDARAKEQGMSIDELKNIEDIQKTSLNKYLLIMKSFLLTLKEENERNES